MSFLKFERQPKNIERKTEIFKVLNNQGVSLGEIKWKVQWRKYCFFTSGHLIFDESCLFELCQYLQFLNREHKLLREL